MLYRVQWKGEREGGRRETESCCLAHDFPGPFVCYFQDYAEEGLAGSPRTMVVEGILVKYARDLEFCGFIPTHWDGEAFCQDFPEGGDFRAVSTAAYEEDSEHPGLGMVVPRYDPEGAMVEMVWDRDTKQGRFRVRDLSSGRVSEWERSDRLGELLSAGRWILADSGAPGRRSQNQRTLEGRRAGRQDADLPAKGGAIIVDRGILRNRKERKKEEYERHIDRYLAFYRDKPLSAPGREVAPAAPRTESKALGVLAIALVLVLAGLGLFAAEKFSKLQGDFEKRLRSLEVKQREDLAALAGKLSKDLAERDRLAADKITALQGDFEKRLRSLEGKQGEDSAAAQVRLEALAGKLSQNLTERDRLAVEKFSALQGDWSACLTPSLVALLREKGVDVERFANLLSKEIPGFRRERGGFVHEKTGMEFVLLPGGKCTMGEGTEAHDVVLPPFLIAKYECTQEQWAKVMGSNPSASKGDSLPVESVSWEDCKEFCEKAELRLPTEAQWEYACRAGSAGKYSFGDEDSRLGDYAWYSGNSDRTHPVGTRLPNAFGLRDMHGNVWEWCHDWYQADYYKTSPKANPQGPDSLLYRVSRGGGFGSDAGTCRSGIRNYSDPGICGVGLGFRCAFLPGS